MNYITALLKCRILPRKPRKSWDMSLKRQPLVETLILRSNWDKRHRFRRLFVYANSKFGYIRLTQLITCYRTSLTWRCCEDDKHEEQTYRFRIVHRLRASGITFSNFTASLERVSSTTAACRRCQVIHNKVVAIELTIHQQSGRFSCRIGFSLASGVTSSVLIRRRM